MPDHAALANKIVEMMNLMEGMNNYDQRIALKVLLELNTLILQKAHGVNEAELKEKDAKAQTVMNKMMLSFEVYLDKFPR